MGDVVRFRPGQKERPELSPRERVERLYLSDTKGTGEILCHGLGKRIPWDVCVHRVVELEERKRKGKPVTGNLEVCLDCPRYLFPVKLVHVMFLFLGDDPEEVPRILSKTGRPDLVDLGPSLPIHVVKEVKEMGVRYLPLARWDPARIAGFLHDCSRGRRRIMLVGRGEDLEPVRNEFMIVEG